MNVQPYVNRKPNEKSFATKRGWAVLNKFNRFGVEFIYEIPKLDAMLYEAGCDLGGKPDAAFETVWNTTMHQLFKSGVDIYQVFSPSVTQHYNTAALKDDEEEIDDSGEIDSTEPTVSVETDDTADSEPTTETVVGAEDASQAESVVPEGDSTDESEPSIPESVEAEATTEQATEASTTDAEEPKEDGEVKPEDYTKEYLVGLSMGDLRTIGANYNVKDNSKDDLADKILDAVAEELLNG